MKTSAPLNLKVFRSIGLLFIFPAEYLSKGTRNIPEAEWKAFLEKVEPI